MNLNVLQSEVMAFQSKDPRLGVLVASVFEKLPSEVTRYRYISWHAGALHVTVIVSVTQV